MGQIGKLRDQRGDGGAREEKRGSGREEGGYSIKVPEMQGKCQGEKGRE